MRKYFLMTVAFFILMCTTTSAMECFSAKYPSATPKVVSFIEGRTFYSTFNKKESAVQQAKSFGLCIEDFGVVLNKVNPLTKKAILWKKVMGYSVWK